MQKVYNTPSEDFNLDVENKISILHKLNIKILRKYDIIIYLMNIFRKTQYSLPDELWVLILNEYVDEGLSPLKTPINFHQKAKYDYAYGKSLCGMPYGIWSLYSKCHYYYFPTFGECPHLQNKCMSLTMHIPITNKNLTFNVDSTLNPSMEKKYSSVEPSIINNPFILYQNEKRIKIGQIKLNTVEHNPLHIRNGLISNIIYNHSDYKLCIQ